jgi:hypothetical protein
MDERRLFLAAVAFEIPTSSIFKKTASEIEVYGQEETAAEG